MFSLATGLYTNYFGTPQLNVLLIGCESVGKTTLLERLKVTEFSPRSDPKPRTVTRNLSCPGPGRYNRAKENQEEVIAESSSERVDSSQRWMDISLDSVSNENIQEDTSSKAQAEGGDTAPNSLTDDVEYNLKKGQSMLPADKIRPTMGQNLAKIDISGAKCHVFDISGKFQDLWERYYPDAEAVIFCWKLSSSDAMEQQQRQVLEKVRERIPDDVPFLIWGHIMDDSPFPIPSSTRHFLPNYHSNVMQLCCGSAKSGKGVREAMEWLIPLAKQHAKLRAMRPGKG